MKEEITITFIVDGYLKEQTVFDAKQLLKDTSKVLQMKFNPERRFDGRQLYIHTRYEEVVKKLAKDKKMKDEEKLQSLLVVVRKLRELYPTEFETIGWWDRRVGFGTTSL